MVRVDFSAYLRFVCTAPRYQETLSRYTATDAIHLVLEAQTVVREEAGGREREKPRQQSERFPVLEGLRKYAANHVLLSGKPGSGKSTTLKRLLLEMAEVALSCQEGKIPVLVQLKSDRPILDAIRAEFRWGKLSVSAEQIDNWLVEGKLFLLLDGVNEIRSDQLRQQLEQFREDNPYTPMIFTTRDLAVGGDLGIEKKLEMRPLTEPQMREFVGKYLPEYGEVLLGQLQDRLREVAETPLLLKMLCEVFDPQTQQIPKSKGELFRAFDRKYNQHKPNPPVSGDFRRFQSEVLQHLAFEMVWGDREKPTEAWLTVSRSKAEGILEEWLGKRGVADAPTKAKEWLEDLLEHHLLQVAADARQIEFHHQLFQEYYAAEALLARVETRHPDVMDDERLQHFYLNYLKWTEPVALMVALLEDEAQVVRVVRLSLAVDLRLGARLAGEVKSEFQPATVAMVSALEIPEWFKVELWEITRSDVVVPGLLRALEDENDSVRWNAAQALGNLHSPEAISGLLTALEDENVIVRKSAASALGNLHSPEAISGLLQALKDKDSFVRWSAAEALGNVGMPEAMPELLQALKDEDSWVRGSAVEALGKLGLPEAIPGLLTALADEDYYVRGSAVEALGKIGSPQAILRLLTALENENSIGHRKAVEALGKIGLPEAIPGLLTALADEDYDVRWLAVEALGEIGSPEAIPGLLIALENENFDVRWPAVEALGKIGSPEAIPRLLTALADENSYVRMSAASALGKLGSPEVIPELLIALEDENYYWRWHAVEALGKIGSPEVIPELLIALEDENYYVRGSAVEALGKIGSPEVIPELLIALEDENYYVLRVMAASALGKLGSPEAISALLTALEDEYPLMCGSVANALGQIKQDKAAHILPNLIALIPTQSGKGALDAISNIQRNCQFYNYEIFRKQLPPVVNPQPSGATVTNNINSEVVQIIENNPGTVIGEQNLKAE
jgi:HEAT repeat protein